MVLLTNRTGRGVDRRVFLSAAATAAAGLVAPACASHRSVGARPRFRPLAPVRVSADRVIRQVAGLRPFRPSGFVVRAEALGDKTLVHNYGHGGGGVSLCWGTAQLALELARETPHRRAAIIGCGAVGLATARLLQDAGFDVTIYARELHPNTTSNIAGAHWSPFSVSDPDRQSASFGEQYDRATRFAFRYFQDLVGPRYGVRWIEDYLLSDDPPQPQTGVVAELIPTRELGAGEHPFATRYVRRRASMMIEPATYLPVVMADFRVAGGRIVVRDFPDRGALLALEERLILNCTGLGSRALFGDEELIPVKGQLTFLLPQREVDYTTIDTGRADDLLYMFPRSDGILLGGTFQRGEWSLEPDPLEARRILEGHARFHQALGRGLA